MTESERTNSPAGAGERTPEEIQAEIDATREQMGDTVEAVAEKADVKTQAKRKAADAKEQAAERAKVLKEKVVASTPESAEGGIAQAQDFGRQNPLQVAVLGGFLAGLVVGRILWR
jgi:hypothetical protein